MAYLHDRAVDVNRAAAVMADSSRPLSRPPAAPSHTFTPSGGRRSNPFFSYATPSRHANRAKDDPEQLAQFFRARSARLDSPIFQRTRVDHGCTYPEVRLGPRFRETSSVPSFFPHENILDFTFEPTKTKSLKIVDLGHKVARNPLPYSILIHQGEEPSVYPVQVRLRANPEKCKNMFVLARPAMDKEEEEEMVLIESEAIAKGLNPPEPEKPFWEHPSYGQNTAPAEDDIEVKFWAAPCEEGIRGNCTMEIIIVDNLSNEHTLELPFTAIGCKPELKITGPGLQTPQKRRAMAVGNSIKVELTDDTPTQPIYVKNESTRGCSVLAAVYLTNDGSIRNQEAPFLLLDYESSVNTKAIVKILEPGDIIEMAVELKVPMGKGALIPPKFLGTVNVRVAYFLNNKPKTESELPQYFDQIIYLEAPRPDGVPLVASPTTTIQEDHHMLGPQVNDNFPAALDFGDDEESFVNFQGPTMTEHLFTEHPGNDYVESEPNNINNNTPSLKVEIPVEVEQGKSESRSNYPDKPSEESFVDSAVLEQEAEADYSVHDGPGYHDSGGSSNAAVPEQEPVADYSSHSVHDSPGFHDSGGSSDATTAESPKEFNSEAAKRDGHDFYKGADSSEGTTSEDEESIFSQGDLTPGNSSDASSVYEEKGEAGEFDDTDDNCINIDRIGALPTPFKNPKYLSPTQQQTPSFFQNVVPTLPEDMGTPPVFNSDMILGAQHDDGVETMNKETHPSHVLDDEQERDGFPQFVNSEHPSASLQCSPNKNGLSLADGEDISEQPQFPDLEDVESITRKPTDLESYVFNSEKQPRRRTRNSTGSIPRSDAVAGIIPKDEAPKASSAWESSPTDIKNAGLKPPEPVKLQIQKSVRIDGVRLESNRNYVTLRLSNARDYGVRVMVEADKNLAQTAEAFLELGPSEKGRFHLLRKPDVFGKSSLRVTAYPQDNNQKPVGAPVVYKIPITVELRT